MLSDKENILYTKAEKCFESLNLAIQTFEDFLKEGTALKSSDYYRARNYLRDAEAAFQETLNEARKLLGPLPPSTSHEYEKWREEFLEKGKILAVCQDLEHLKEELRNDQLLSRWLSSDELDVLLNKHFDSQQRGRRKLSSIKVRLIFEKLNSMVLLGEELHKKAKAKLQEKGIS